MATLYMNLNVSLEKIPAKNGGVKYSTNIPNQEQPFTIYIPQWALPRPFPKTIHIIVGSEPAPTPSQEEIAELDALIAGDSK